MQPLIRFPKTANIRCDHLNDLDIKNHEVVNPSGLFNWLLCAVSWTDNRHGNVKHCSWDDVVTQMIQQGIRFDVFIEQCVNDLKNLQMFEQVLWWLHNNHGVKHDRQEFESYEKIRHIETRVREELCICENWKHLHDVMRPGSKFRNDMMQKVGAVMLQ